MSTIFCLPFPPSVNNYWRQARGKTYISAAGVKYRKDVAKAVKEQGVPEIKGKVYLCVDAFVPDARRRDLDNMFKATLDAIQKAGVIKDDGDIDYLSIERRPKVPGGELKITLGPVTEWGIGQ